MKIVRLLLLIGVPYALAAMSLLLISLPLTLISKEFGVAGPLAGFIGGSVFIGMFLGAILLGSAADKIGRKKSLILALLILGLSTLSCSLVKNWMQLIVLRIITGIGIGSTIPLCFVYLTEFTKKENRGKVLVLLDSFWAYGWIIATLLGYFVIPQYGWRMYFMASSVPVILVALLLAITLHETPMYASQRLSLSFLERLKVLWSRELIRMTLCTWIMWFTMVFGYYSFFIWIIGYMRKMGYPLPAAYFYSLITSFAQIPGYFSAAYLVDKVGRKKTLISYTIATAISVMGFAYSKTAEELVLWLSLICFFCLGAWGIVMCYTGEVFPTRVRGTGYGFASGFGRIAGIVGPTLVGYLLTTIGLINTLCLVALVFILLAIDMAILGIETKNIELV